MIALLGIACNIKYPIVGVITTSPVNLFSRKDRILVAPELNAAAFGYAEKCGGVFGTSSVQSGSILPIEKRLDNIIAAKNRRK